MLLPDFAGVSARPEVIGAGEFSIEVEGTGVGELSFGPGFASTSPAMRRRKRTRDLGCREENSER